LGVSWEGLGWASEPAGLKGLLPPGEGLGGPLAGVSSPSRAALSTGSS